MDSDNDGFLTIGELEEAMKDTKYLGTISITMLYGVTSTLNYSFLNIGVVGCDWKFYVDPAQDIFCYHNIHKGIKVLHFRCFGELSFITGIDQVFEYQITDELLKEINEANYIAESVNGIS